MKVKGNYHIPVLLKEVIDLLKVESEKKYIDATLGGGGHSEEIIKRGGSLLAIDWDLDAVKYATERLKKACPASSPKVVYGNFAEIDEIASRNGFKKVETCYNWETITLKMTNIYKNLIA